MRRLAYLAAVVGCGLCYLTFGRWLLWMLLLGLLALPVVSLVLSIPALRSIRLGVAGPDRVKVGEKAELLLMGSCDMPMPPFRGRILLRDLRTGRSCHTGRKRGSSPKTAAATRWRSKRPGFWTIWACSPSRPGGNAMGGFWCPL